MEGGSIVNTNPKNRLRISFSSGYIRSFVRFDGELCGLIYLCELGWGSMNTRSSEDGIREREVK